MFAFKIIFDNACYIAQPISSPPQLYFLEFSSTVDTAYLLSFRISSVENVFLKPELETYKTTYFNFTCAH